MNVHVFAIKNTLKHFMELQKYKISEKLVKF